MCGVLSAGCLPMAAYAESVEAPVVESVLQQKAISGKVVDSKGESIIGANIMEKGTTNGTITDFDGNFSLNVSAKAVLRLVILVIRRRKFLRQSVEGRCCHYLEGRYGSDGRSRCNWLRNTA